MTTQLTNDQALAGIWATTSEPLPFAPDTAIRAFLLERRQGNLLIYNNEALAGDVGALRERGGVTRQYLNHGHEAMFGSDAPARELGAKLLVHAEDADSVARRGWDAHLTFTRRHALDEDFEVIPTPGHTKGATAYLWNTGAERLLFTGDSLYLRGEEWGVAVLESSDRAAYLQSLELLREVEFDVLVPWAATVDGPWHSRVTDGERRARLDAVIQRVRAGESH